MKNIQKVTFNGANKSCLILLSTILESLCISPDRGLIFHLSLPKYTCITEYVLQTVYDTPRFMCSEAKWVPKADSLQGIMLTEMWNVVR
jgi:hypothetical protein